MGKPQREGGGEREERREDKEKKEGENLYSTWREGEVTRQERMDDLPHL